ncbi:MAG: hypothetical protein R3C11_18725 [Planctomycetaceae bacterium]
MSHFKFASFILAVSLFCCHPGLKGIAQEPETPEENYTPPGQIESTSISFELLTGARGQNFTARQWYDFFADLQIPVQIRQSVREETPYVNQEVSNKIRKVHVVAIVESDGTLKLPSGRVKTSEHDKLKKWIDSLKEYGAQGDPGDKPLWGLSNEQYVFLRAYLAQPLEVDLQGKKFSEGLLSFPFTAELPVVLSDATKDFLRDSEIRNLPFAEDLKGLSLGSSLAIYLREYDLGFVPTRLPTGRIVLTVDKLADIEEEVWPIGWDWEKSPTTIAPQFFKRVTVRIRDFSLFQFLDYIEEGADIRIVVDHYNFRAVQLDPATLKLTIRPDITAWNLLLNRGLRSVRLDSERRLDEAGKPFLWIGPSKSLIHQRMKAIDEGRLPALDSESSEDAESVPEETNESSPD